MKVNFLGASDGTPLAKKFEEIAPGNYKETSYPHVAKFTSIERDVATLQEMLDLIVACAGEGLCLLKGELDQPLENESRAGHTSATAMTQWVCLDIDYNVVGQTPRAFLEALAPEFKGVSFIFQKSSSMGIKHHEGWRGHFFVLLDTSQSPQALKQWLIDRNLSCPNLRSHIGLSASGGALTYPLDVTTCQNDKLLYIANPQCVGFDDPVKDRFVLDQGSKEAACFNSIKASAAGNQTQQQGVLTAKRKDLQLPKKTFRTKQHQGTEVLTNPDPITVTGKKIARDFVYLNLNGGDSWGYFFPLDNPEILYNFKGEPCLYMWDVDKDIYNEHKRVISTLDPAAGAVPFGFLWPHDDTYYRGFAVPDTQELVWLQSVGSKQKLRDFFVQNGVSCPSGWVVDEWQLDFDPTTEGCADFGVKRVNTYKRTKYIRDAKMSTAGIPPVIDRVLTSVCVDEETKDYFLNWLAYIFQTRQKTNTAWIFQGVQGTGKGVLFSRVVAPLIGRSYCHEMTMDRLDDDFNAYLGDNIILFIDEANISDSRNGDRLLNRIKNLVTEPEQHIRGMRRNAVIRRNYSNIILASNYDEIIPMEGSDRRFNVAPRQEEPIQLEHDDILIIETELPDFASYLHSYKVDQRNVRRVLLSEARTELINLSTTTITTFFHAIKDGDLAYFTQYLDNEIKADIESIRYHDYALVVKRWIRSVGDLANVSRNEMRTCYQFLQGASISATKFTRMCAKYGFLMMPIRIEGQVTRGIRDIRWTLSREEREHQEETEGSNVVKFKEKK